MATDFVDRYTTAYGEAPSTFAGHAYDALYLIVEAAKRVTGDLTPAALRDEIEKPRQASSASAARSTSRAEDHNGMTASDLTMYEIANGDWTLAQ